MKKDTEILNALKPGKDLARDLSVSRSAISHWRLRGIQHTQRRLIWELFRARLNKAGIYEDEPVSEPAERV